MEKLKSMINSDKENFSSIIYYDELVQVSPKAKAFHFWEFSKDLNISSVYRKGFLKFLTEHGFYRRVSSNGSWGLVKITNGVIEYVCKEDIVIYIKNYVESITKPLKIYYSRGRREYKVIESEQFANVFYKQFHLVINEAFLIALEFDNSQTLNDTKDSAYLLFKNTVVKVTEDNVTLSDYSEFDNLLVFESQIIDSDFEFNDEWKNCQFAQFVRNITNDDTNRKNALRSAIGYLIHGFNDPAKSQAVILYDEELTDKNTPKGGTGKGIIGQALSKIKKAFIQLDGKSLRLDSQFLFQRIKEDTRIIFIDDVAKNFDIDRLNSILTEGITIEEKFKKPVHIAKVNMPKFLIASNIILPFDGTTRTRRQFVIELSNHYSNKLSAGITEPILQEHKARFFSEEWSNSEWNGFYTFIVKSVQYYLANGLVPPPKLNMEINWLIQKIGKQAYYYFESIELQKGQERITKDIYEEFKKQILDDSYSQRLFSDNLKAYLKYKGMSSKFDKGKVLIE
ncbi:MAG: hypothetical protein H7Y13_09595 [Sphingobacteriaceae bacterium]|nr:hypothetical protein [Sphingobacteriaceae bacterium]